jgi:hypothetical protein
MTKQNRRLSQEGSKKSRAEKRLMKRTQKSTQEGVTLSKSNGTSGITKTTKNGKADPLKKVLEKIDVMPLSKWLRLCEAIPCQSLM